MADSLVRKTFWGIVLILSLAAARVEAQGLLTQKLLQQENPNSSEPVAAAQTQPFVDEAIQLTIVPKSDEADLSWQTDLPNVSHFQIRKSNAGATELTVLKEVDSTIHSFTDTNVTDGQTSYYSIAALDAAGNLLGSSSVQQATPPEPKTLIEAIHGKTITIQDMEDLSFWQDSVKTLVVGVLTFIPKLIVAIILFGIFWLIYRMIRKIVIGSMNRAHVDPSIRDMLAALIRWSIMGFGLVIACNQIGLEIAALLTGVSIIGLAIGFAAQETLANFIAGVVIFWDKPFKVGDWIVIDGMFGQVLRVSFRSTRMLNLNGETVVMANTSMLDNRVFNHSTHPYIRIVMPIGIAYKESIEEARKAILATVVGDSRICVDPPPDVVVDACADSSVNLLFRVWIRDESQEKTIYAEFLEKAKVALDHAHIEIPFPHMQLFLEETPVLKALAQPNSGSAKPG
jgi:small conductance mechanosensitive channel